MTVGRSDAAFLTDAGAGAVARAARRRRARPVHAALDRARDGRGARRGRRRQLGQHRRESGEGPGLRASARTSRRSTSCRRRRPNLIRRRRPAPARRNSAAAASTRRRARPAMAPTAAGSPTGADAARPRHAHQKFDDFRQVVLVGRGHMPAFPVDRRRGDAGALGLHHRRGPAPGASPNAAPRRGRSRGCGSWRDGTGADARRSRGRDGRRAGRSRGAARARLPSGRRAVSRRASTRRSRATTPATASASRTS